MQHILMTDILSFSSEITLGDLTLNMLNCFEDYKICIHISYHILDFIQQKKIKVTMEQPYVLPILYCQCHACWCTGDFRSQCINRHGIDLQSRNIPSLASEELIDESTCQMPLHHMASLVANVVFNEGHFSEFW